MRSGIKFPTLKIFLMISFLIASFYFFCTTSQFKKLSLLPSLRRIECFYTIKAHQNCLWVGTEQGIRCYDRDKKIWLCFSKEDGLIGNHVQALAFDENTLWVGTWSGLSKYDLLHQKWQNFTMKDGLPASQIQTLACDKKFVYLGTNGGGFCVYDKEKGSFKTFNQHTRPPLKSNYVYAVKVKDNEIWLGCSGGILGRYNLENQEMTNYQSPNSYNIFYAIDFDEENLWLASRDGVYRFSPRCQIWKRFGSKEGLPHAASYSLVVSREGIWVGTEKGLVKYSPEIDFWAKFTHRRLIDSSGRPGVVQSLFLQPPYLWVGTYQLGLAQLSEEKLTWKFSSAGLTDNYIKTLAWDGENLWFGFDYQQAGVNQYHLGKKFFKFHPLPKTRVILVDQDNIWFGTWGGLKKYVKTTGQWETLTTQNGLVANDITSLFSSPTTLWIGTYYGLNQLNKLNNQIKIHLKGEEVLVITGNENFIFAGNSRGEINRYSLTEKKWEKITYLPLLNQRISAMIAIKDQLWIGTEGTGIFVYSLSEEKWTQYRTGWQGEWGKLKSNYITCFLKKNEFLYLGTDKGLGRINLRNFKWQWLREKDGLVNEEILSLTLTDQDLWAGTWVGAVKIDENRF